MWSKLRRVLQSFIAFFTFHLLKNSSLAVSSRCLNLNSVRLTEQERGERNTQEWKFQHVPMYKWKSVVTLSVDHDLCNPLTLPLWAETRTFHLSQQHLCMTPSYPAEGFSLNSDVFICCFSSVAPGCTASDWLLSAHSLVCHERRRGSDVLRKKSVWKHLSGNVCAGNKSVWAKMEGLGFSMIMDFVGCHTR